MALVGGGGAGNTAGGNPSGTGSSLNYIGDHAWGNSGQIQATAETVGLDFTSAANQYIVGTMTALFDCGSIEGGNQFGYVVTFDGQIVCDTTREALDDDRIDSPLPAQVDLLIPPSTRVVISAQTSGGQLDMTFNFVGRVY